MPRKRVMPKTHPIILKSQEKQILALDLRMAGKTYREIGQEIGVSENTAWNYIDGLLKKYSEYFRERVPQLIELEVVRLEALVAVLWPLATGETPQLGAIDRLLMVSKRKSKLLGLDQPYQMQVQHGLTPEALEEMRNRRWAAIETRMIGVLTAEQPNVIEAEFVEVEETKEVSPLHEEPEVEPMTDEEVDVVFGWHSVSQEEHAETREKAAQDHRIAQALAEEEKLRAEARRIQRDGAEGIELPLRKISSSWEGDDPR